MPEPTGLTDQEWLAYKRDLEARRFFGTLQVSLQAGKIMNVQETRNIKPYELKESLR